MAHVAAYLSIGELERRYRACEDACSARHYQTIWLLAQGHTVPEVSALTSFVPRWIEELQARYNALGPQALGDLRRNNGTLPSLLKPELLQKLKVRLKEPSPDGSVWTGRKVAAFMAAQLGSRSLRHSAAVRRCKRSVGRSSRRVRAIRTRQPPKRWRLLKKACRHTRRRSQQASRQADRGLGDG